MAVEPGTYIGIVVAHRLGYLGEHPVIEVVFEIPKAEGQHLSWVGWTSEEVKEGNSMSGLQVTMRTLTEALGWDAAAARFMLDDLNGTVHLVGREARLVVEMETNQKTGKSYPRIQWVNTIWRGRLKENDIMDATDASSFSERMAGVIQDSANGTTNTGSEYQAPQASSGGANPYPAEQAQGGALKEEEPPF